jgi:hypothetical protein
VGVTDNKNGTVSLPIFDAFKSYRGAVTLSLQQIKILRLLDQEPRLRRALPKLVFKKRKALTNSERASLSRSVARLFSCKLITIIRIEEWDEYSGVEIVYGEKYLGLSDRGHAVCETLERHVQAIDCAFKIKKR